MCNKNVHLDKMSRWQDVWSQPYNLCQQYRQITRTRVRIREHVVQDSIYILLKCTFHLVCFFITGCEFVSARSLNRPFFIKALTLHNKLTIKLKCLLIFCHFLIIIICFIHLLKYKNFIYKNNYSIILKITFTKKHKDFEQIHHHFLLK